MVTGGQGSGRHPDVSSNFAFLRADWPGLFEDTRRAERLTLLDPRTSCFYARRTLEQLVKWRQAQAVEACASTSSV
ncbi:MAG: DUF4145 domain-containing protein, partial [Acidobacteria bacterium]|nr:DUF4145 domain-containing protein [Acidobacteriota bacterium]